MSDLISRQDAIEQVHSVFSVAIDETPTEVDEDGFVLYADTEAVNKLLRMNKAISTRIRALPSADKPQGEQVDGGNETTSMVSEQIKELRKYAKKWSEWNGFDAAMPVLPCTNIRLLHSAADTIEALNRPTGKWIDIANDEYYRCSLCGCESGYAFYYCPNCGADMNETRADDE